MDFFPAQRILGQSYRRATRVTAEHKQQVVLAVLLSACEVVNHLRVFHHCVLPARQQSATKSFYLRRSAQ
jgi:hypothetical protein